MQYQIRLSQILSSFREKKVLSAREMANRMGVSPSTYSRYEHPSKHNRQFQLAVECILKYSNAVGMQPTQFIHFVLTGNNIGIEDNGRQLRTWEIKTLKVVSKVKLGLKNAFCKKGLESDKSEISRLLSFFVEADRDDWDEFIRLCRKVERKGSKKWLA